MYLFFTVTWWLIGCTTFVKSKKLKDLDHEDIDSTDYTNASLYTTSEMRDKVLAEWKGKTEEIQGYFDQLPSEEFKENSEDLKFKYYYEGKGIKNIDTNQVLNITPHVQEPVGPVYTIEVNDSYVPKYRITKSEEERMEKYGTFNSVSESSEISSEEVKRKKKKKKKKSSSESGGEKSKKKKEKKTWPTNMDPKEKRKKKKKPKITEDEKKRKDAVEKTLNGLNHNRVNLKNIQEGNAQMKNTNPGSVLQKNSKLIQGKIIDEKYAKINNLHSRNENKKIKQSYLKSGSKNKYLEKKITEENKVDHKLLNNNEIENKLDKLERTRKRSRQSINSNHLRPFL